MRVNRVSTAIAAAALNVGVMYSGSIASAADMPVKALPPPVASPFVLDVHGFFDVSFKNAYITPRGLLVTNTGLTTQVLGGMVLDIYKDKSGFINDVSVYGGVWNDLWSKQNDPHVGSWNEFDWFIGGDVKFAQYWKFGAQYIEFVPPAHDLITSFPSVERNVEFSLSYDDSNWWGGAPFAINPYVKLFYAASGPSTVVLGKGGDTFDVELGIAPSYDFKKSTGVALTLSAPTWITVGPEDYWNKGVFIAGNASNINTRFFAGASNFCGPQSNLACETSDVGVFSTGIKGKLMIDSVVPKRLGDWYITGGVQYYRILNDALQAAQIFTGSGGGASNVYGSFPQTHQDIVVASAGFGFGF
jgi:hypothetical protein